jgi:ribosomal protein S8
MYSKIRNAYLVRRRFVAIPMTILNLEIIRVLYKEGFLDGMYFSNSTTEFTIFLKYVDGKPMFKKITRCNGKNKLIYHDKRDLNTKFKSRQIFIISSSTKGIFLSSSVIDPLEEGGSILGKIHL